MGMSMTKEEAIQAMKNGRKVRHCYFSKEEWMTMNSDGMVVLEDGVICTLEDIYRWRTSKNWEDGYEVID